MRPQKFRNINFLPNVTYFKPQGIPLKDIDEVVLTIDELEAVRLANFEGIHQVKCANKMKVSQSTFQRIITCANNKIAEALFKGKAIKIEGGRYKMSNLKRNNSKGFEKRLREFKCEKCKNKWEEPSGSGPGIEKKCPNCQSSDIHRIEFEGHGPGRQPWGYKN